jgi:hypothetical protein
LIGEVQAANRWSYADIAANAQNAGRQLSKSHVESLRNGRLPSISVKAIESLAAGLQVSPARVAQAAIETMGYRVGSDADSPSAQSAIASDPRLSEPVRRVLLAALAAAYEQPGKRVVGMGEESAHLQKTAADDATMDD